MVSGDSRMHQIWKEIFMRGESFNKYSKNTVFLADDLSEDLLYSLDFDFFVATDIAGDKLSRILNNFMQPENTDTTTLYLIYEGNKN